MQSKRTTRSSPRTEEEKQRHEALRTRFQAERPSLDALVASGEYSPPMKQEEFFALLEFSAQLREERERQKISLSELSDRCGIDKAAISRIESGANLNPTIATLESIAHALGAELRLQLIVPSTTP